MRTRISLTDGWKKASFTFLNVTSSFSPRAACQGSEGGRGRREEEDEDNDGDNGDDEEEEDDDDDDDDKDDDDDDGAVVRRSPGTGGRWRAARACQVPSCLRGWDGR